MSEPDLQARARAFASRVATLVSALPRDRPGTQLLGAVTSIESSCRAAYQTKSPDDFSVKMGFVQTTAREALEWLEIVGESKLVTRVHLADLMSEGRALIAMAVAARSTHEQD